MKRVLNLTLTIEWELRGGALYSFEYAVNLVGSNKVRPPKNCLIAFGQRFKQIRYSQVPVTTTLPVTPRNGFFGPSA